MHAVSLVLFHYRKAAPPVRSFSCLHKSILPTEESPCRDIVLASPKLVLLKHSISCNRSCLFLPYLLTIFRDCAFRYDREKPVLDSEAYPTYECAQLLFLPDQARQIRQHHFHICLSPGHVSARTHPTHPTYQFLVCEIHKPGEDHGQVARALHNVISI